MFTVRQTRSGYGGFPKFLVYNGSKRVTVNAFVTRESAQASADELNIGALVKPHAGDPRTYAERLEEAREQYRQMKEGKCPGCGETFNGIKGLRIHQAQKYVTLACKNNN